MARTKTEVKLENSSSSAIDTVKKPVAGFFDFLGENSVLAMALGIIIGATVKDTVDALVTGIITPAIQLFLPNTQLQDLVVTVNKSEFRVGLFFEAFLQMMIIMVLLYIVIGVIMNRQDLISKKKKK